jgi:predicted NBD/HSP70 family sugar kinase
MERNQDFVLDAFSCQQCDRTGALDRVLSGSGLRRAQVHDAAERGGMTLFARTICAHDLFARFVRRGPQASGYTRRYIGD